MYDKTVMTVTASTRGKPSPSDLHFAAVQPTFFLPPTCPPALICPIVPVCFYSLWPTHNPLLLKKFAVFFWSDEKHAIKSEHGQKAPSKSSVSAAAARKEAVRVG